MIDLNAKLTTLRGTSYTKTFAKDEEEAKQPETVANVLLNSLSAYPVRQKKEVFLLNHIASKILDAKEGQLELPEDQVKFLADVLFESTYQTDKKGEKKGVYFAPLIAQVLTAIGVNELN